MNETETHAEHIDPQLAAAGWGVVEDSRIRREYPITLGRTEGAGRRGKARTTQSMTATSFWHPDGTPMSAQQSMEALFGKLPEFFSDEAELRAQWSAPETRKKLLEELDQAKLTPLLRLKCHDSVADAVADLGRSEEIGRVFAGFQKYLYQRQATV